jgi:hypothetical protein
MPSGLFNHVNGQWVFAGPTPPSFQGYTQDHTKLLVDYIMQLTPEEQRKVAASMGRSTASNVAPKNAPKSKKPSVGASRHSAPRAGAAGGGSR